MISTTKNSSKSISKNKKTSSSLIENASELNTRRKSKKDDEKREGRKDGYKEVRVQEIEDNLANLVKNNDKNEFEELRFTNKSGGNYDVIDN